MAVKKKDTAEPVQDVIEVVEPAVVTASAVERALARLDELAAYVPPPEVELSQDEWNRYLADWNALPKHERREQRLMEPLYVRTPIGRVNLRTATTD